MALLDDIVASLSGSGGNLPSPGTANAFGTALDTFGADMGAASHLMFGMQARQAANFQAAQLRQNANSAEASSQRTAADIDLQTKMVTSRALAVAAASGGGASDPTVVNLIARDAARGAYLKSVALYQGEDHARLLEEQAQAKEYEGKTTERNSELVAGAQTVKGAANMLQGMARGASLYSRFAGNGPPGFSSAAGPGDSGWGMDLGTD